MKKNSKTKVLNKTAMLKNICGLSVGDRAYCGPYGIVTCTKSAGSMFINGTNAAGNYRGMQNKFTRNSRRFSVSGSKKLQNRGNWTMKQFHEAICA